ncbi:permease-like cell division protein FtsX [Saccharopolyspora cebuensis]|uniref:permease-like cell division protein FtsX n=1 Tax=Saccharopolyspora cebuensis TaxID=418759 RepID=UPI0031F17038
MKNSMRALGTLVVGAALAACTVQGSAPQRPPAPTVPLAGHDLCGDHVGVFFDTDEEMHRRAAAVAADDRVRQVYTETKEQAYVQFKEMFADDPHLVELASPEALPAGLQVLPLAGADVRALADDLRQEHPGARIEVFVRPPFVPGQPPCPPNGLWPTR